MAPVSPTLKEIRYYPLLDAFRFLAAVAIVWLHIEGVPATERSKDLGRFAVPFFTCAAVFLAFDALRRRPDTTVGKYFSDRLWRIYPLFLAWSVIYWVARSGSSVLLEHKGWLRPTVREFLLDGIAIQLWFLPFIIVATTAAFTVSKLVAREPRARLPMAGLMAAGGLAASLYIPGWIWTTGYSPELSYEALPACAWGIALGLLNGRGPVGSVAAAAGAAGFGAWLVLSLLYGRILILEDVAGLGLLLLALNRAASRPTPWLAVLGSISFGIYLAHALFVEGLQHILPRLGLGPGGLREGLIWLLAVVGSCALIFGLKRAGRWPAWLAG